MRQIIIEGERVKYLNTEVVKEVSVADFVGHIEENLPINTGILPRNCLYMKREGRRVAYMIEVPAMLCPVKLRNRKKEGKAAKLHNFVISTPFTQFYVGGSASNNIVNKVYVSVTKSPVRTLKDKVYISPYLNIFDQGTSYVCTGNMILSDKLDFIGKINGIVSLFFEAESNDDLMPNIPKGFSTTPSRYTEYYKEWDELTKKDRFFGVSDSVEYPEFSYTIEQLLDKSMQ